VEDEVIVPRGRAAPALFALAALAGCALVVDLDGLEGPPLTDGGNGDGTSPSPTPDAAPPDDARAADTAPPCAAKVTVDSKFDATLADWRGLQMGVSGYPTVESFLGDPAAVLLPKITVPPGAGTDGGPPDPQKIDARSGLWRPSAVPLVAFDLDVETNVTCTSSASCADGLAIAWIDSADLADLDNQNYGHISGFPKARNGAAIIFDDYQNDPAPDEVSDPAPPTLQIIQLDADKAVGTYKWHVATAPLSFLGAWQKVHVALRNGEVTVTVGSTSLAGKVRPFARGLFGFTTGTGGKTDAVAVRNVHAKFYDCAP
jgi:Legume-like lectin family